MVRAPSDDRVHWISQRGKIKPVVVSKVFELNSEYSQNHSRQPKQPPPPEGWLTLSEAEAKYQRSTGVLSRWADKGYIKTLSPIKKRGRKRYVLESDVAKQVEVYKRNPGRGKWTIRQALGNGEI